MNLQLSNTNERVKSIDIIRGFALIGIFFVNVPTMLMPDLFYEFGYDGIDRFIRLLYDLFIQTKFYTIFAFLFGASAFYFMNGIEKKNLSPFKYFSRRLFWMFIFGVIHITLFWSGDILHTYALLGFALLLFYKRKVKTMLIWAGCLFSIYFLLETLSHFLLANQPNDLSLNNLFTAFYGANGDVNFYHHYIDQVKERTNFFLTTIPYELFIYPFEFVSIFLVGMATAKMGLFSNTSLYLKGIKTFQYITFLASIPFLVLMVLEFLNNKEASTYYIFISGKLLATFYVCSILRLLQKPLWEKRLSVLAPLGKMAFTNYICHSIITLAIVSVFINDTLSISLWVQPIYVTIIIILQIFFSRYLLSKWRQGPLEYIWRLLTYGTIPSRKSTVSREM